MSGGNQRCAVSAISFLLFNLIASHACAQSVPTDGNRTMATRSAEVTQTDGPNEVGTVSFAATAIVSLVEVDPPEGVVVDVVQDRRWFEIRLKNWAPALLIQWQASIDPASLIPNAAGSIAPAQEPCCSDDWCEHAFGAGATCNATQGLCTPAFQDATHYNWAFDAPSGPIAPPYLTFSGTTTNVGPVADDGTERYAGTLVIDPSYVAIEVPSSFPIDFLPPPDTFLLDQSAAQIPLLATEPGVVALVGGACCDAAHGSCYELTTRLFCTGSSKQWHPGCACYNCCLPECIAAWDCDDGNSCTNEVCDPFAHCSRSLNYDPRTECCVPNGPLFGDDTAKLNPCLRIVCDEQALTFSFEPLPAGSPCDDGDICTRRSFCNAAGKCVGHPAIGAECPKNRYVSFMMDELLSSECGSPRAVRVTFVNLDGFASFNGQTRWLSAPSVYPEVGTSGGFSAAELQCTPHFDNFGAPGMIHVFGAGIVPNSTYEIQTVDQTCADLNDPACYSAPLVVQTGAWGDVVIPFLATDPIQPDFKDITAQVASFLASPAAPIKARAQLQPSAPVPGNAIDFKDITAVVSAFLGAPYPFDGPTACQ